MLPVYYDDPPTSFGIVHPCEGTGRSHSLIVCQALLGEAICTHWVLKRVADWASKSGYDVFRFDFSGTGNSLIAPATIELSDWQNDIGRARDFVEDRFSNSRTTILGARLSFALAGLASLQSDVDMLIGWDPVLDGKTWLDDRKSDREQLADGSYEYQGYALNNTMLTQLAELQVRNIDCVQAAAVTTSRHRWDCPPANLGIDALQADDEWNWGEPANAIFYAHNSLRLICELMT